MAQSFLIFFFLFLLFSPLVPSQSRSLVNQHPKDKKKKDNNQDCTGRWIHVVPLPSRFNSDLLRNCSGDSFPLYSSASFCHHLSNHGLGPRTHNRSRSWFRTDTFLSLELHFHRRLLEYPCLTSDPASSDAVFLPFYTSLTAFPLLYSPSHFGNASSHGLDLHRHLFSRHPGLLSRHHSHDLFLVSALSAWDLSQDPASDNMLWGTSFLEIPQFMNVTLLTIESRLWPWQERAIPYPTSFHPATLARLDAWLARARRSRRTNLALFVGGGGSGGINVRASIRSECGNRTDACQIVDCSKELCTHDPVRFMRPMLRSDFCLQPPGDTPTRRSTFDGILAGCIPVFFEELGAYHQYGWHLPKNEFYDFSVFIPKEDVVFRGVKIIDILEKIPRARVRKMRQRLLELAPRVMYRRHGSSDGLRQRKDAFDIAIEGVLRRIRWRVKAIQDPDLLYEDENDEAIL